MEQKVPLKKLKVPLGGTFFPPNGTILNIHRIDF